MGILLGKKKKLPTHLPYFSVRSPLRQYNNLFGGGGFEPKHDLSCTQTEVQ